MEGLNLYFDQKERTYFHTGSPVCFKCGCSIKEIVFIYSGFSTRESFIREYCVGCVKTINDKLSVVKEIKKALVINKPPITATLVFIKPPSISNTSSSASVFEASSPSFDRSRGDFGVKIKNNAVISKDPNRNIQIDAKSKEDINLSLEDKERKTSIKEDFKLLKDLQKAKPVLSEKEKCLLECKK